MHLEEYLSDVLANNKTMHLKILIYLEHASISVQLLWGPATKLFKSVPCHSMEFGFCDGAYLIVAKIVLLVSIFLFLKG